MTAIEILQNVMVDTEQLLRQLNAGGSRLYEISTAGTIVERTSQMHAFYSRVLEQLRQAIELLRT